MVDVDQSTGRLSGCEHDFNKPMASNHYVPKVPWQSSGKLGGLKTEASEF